MAKQREIICGRVPNCGFRVHEEYFKLKPRFAPGVCPRCGGPVVIVEARTDKPVEGYHINLSVVDGPVGAVVAD